MKSEVVFRMPFICDMLVDQNKTIGRVPVGFKCGRDATTELEIPFQTDSGCRQVRVLMCEGCFDKYQTNPERLTLPPFFGREYQIRCVQEIVDSFVKESRRPTPTSGDSDVK